MRNFIYKISFVFAILMSFLGYSQNCGDHSENDYNAIFQSISDAQNAGNQSDANSLIENAKSMVINDLFYLVNENIPSSKGNFCKSNAVTDYMNCLSKLASKGEFLGVDATITNKARDRYKEAVDFWTTELANSSNTFNGKPCEDYLKCLFKAQIDRDLANVAKNATDAKLQQKIDDILLKGCEPCSSKWMVIAEVNISFYTSKEEGGERLVTVKGRATWDVIDIILDVNKYQDKCNMMGLSLAATLPSVHYTNPGLPKPRLELIDGDETFAKEMVDANLDLDVESTDLLNTIELNAYLGFSETGQSAKIPVKDKLFNLEKRLPFSVSQVVRNDETPDYKAEFKFYFTPVFDY